ncbi:MAG: DUF6883 domain-containing protein [Bacteroidota bacterium]
MNLLPDADKAVLKIEKLKDYCLNNLHPVGKHKARVFQSVLGLNADNAEELKNFILEKIKKNKAILGETDKYGQRYVVDMIFSKYNKQVVIRTSWIIKTGTNYPCFTSCYIKM